MNNDTRKALDTVVTQRASVANALINASIFIFKYFNMGVEPILYEPLFGILGFVIEVLFVQRYFKSSESSLVKIPYGDYLQRSKSFLSKNIVFKALVANIISQVVSINITDYISILMNKLEIPRWKYTELAIKLVSGITTGVLFVNLLKYRWAYIDVSESNLNAIVLAWFSIVLMLHILGSVIKTKCGDRRDAS
jgi:hypothetical protein